RAQRTGSRRPRAAVPAARDVRGPGRGREFLAFPDSDVHVQAPRTTTVAAIPAATPASSRMRRPMAATGVSQTWYPFRGDCHVRKFLVLLPTEGREAHGRPGRIVVLEATKRGRPWPKWIVCPSWVAGRVIAYGIGVRRIGAASPGRCWNWRP